MASRDPTQIFGEGTVNEMGTIRGQVKMIDHFMKEEGKKHGFTAEPISIAKGRQKTLYVGYLLKPA